MSICPSAGGGFSNALNVGKLATRNSFDPRPGVMRASRANIDSMRRVVAPSCMNGAVAKTEAMQRVSSYGACTGMVREALAHCTNILSIAPLCAPLCRRFGVVSGVGVDESACGGLLSSWGELELRGAVLLDRTFLDGRWPSHGHAITIGFAQLSGNGCSSRLVDKTRGTSEESATIII